MHFSQAIRSGFENYVNVGGRAQRSAFWYWQLFCFLSSMAFAIADTIIFSGLRINDTGPISTLWSLAIFIPSITVAVRRLHDRDMSGWFLLLILIPLIGFFVLLYFFVTPGTDGENRFGANPLGHNNNQRNIVRDEDERGYSQSNIPRVDRDD